MLKQEKIDPFWKLIQPEFKTQLAGLVIAGSLPHPLVVDIDPISGCNSECRFCIDADNLEGNHFSKKSISRLLKELKAMGTKSVVIVGGGEPLTYPHLEHMLNLAAKLEFKIGLVTNGLRLHIYQDVIAKTCDWIRISVDAARSDTYNFLHRPKEGSFNDLVKHMEALAKVKTAASSMGFSFIVTNRNVKEISAAAGLAAKVGCDFFELKTLIAPNSKAINALSPESHKSLFQELKKLRSVRTHINLVFTDSIFALLKNESDRGSAHRCYAKKLRAVITPDGVYPCANLRGNKRWLLGDPKKERLAFIWRRNNSLEIDPAVTCSGYCARRKFNISLECLSMAEQKGVSLINYLTAPTQRIESGDKYFI